MIRNYMLKSKNTLLEFLSLELSLLNIKYFLLFRILKIKAMYLCKRFLVLINIFRILKGAVSQDFRHFFYKKKPPGLLMNRQKSLAKSFVLAKIFANICKNHVSASCWLWWHGVRVVLDYTDTMSVWSLTTWTLCLRGHWLHRHSVSLVVDYANVSANSTTSLTNCKLFYFGKRKNIMTKKLIWYCWKLFVCLVMN